MRWTICYSLMTACLGSVLAYGYHNVKAGAPLTPLNRQLDKAFAIDQSNQGPVVRKHKKVSALDAVQADESPTVKIGATRDEVLAILGKPAVVNDTNDRWTYGLHVILFNDDRVAGCVRLDEDRAADAVDHQVKLATGKSGAGRNKYSYKKGNRNPYLTSNMNRKYNSSARYASSSSRVRNGSSRGLSNYGYRSGTGSGSTNSNNYYMSRSGPRYQSFFSTMSRPRGMTGNGGRGGSGSYNGSWVNSWSNAWGGASSANRNYSSSGRSSR